MEKAITPSAWHQAAALPECASAVSNALCAAIALVLAELDALDPPRPRTNNFTSHVLQDVILVATTCIAAGLSRAGGSYCCWAAGR
jgi:hypothetical protein